MVSRPNLAKYHCERIEAWTHLNLSYALAERLIHLSHGGVNKQRIPSHVLYGSVHTLQRVPHVLRGMVQLVKPAEGYGEYHVGFVYIRDKWPRPPKGIKPVSVLMEAIKDEAQEATFWCYVHFAYPEEPGRRSTIELPQPLRVGVEQQVSFTHVEGLELSKRVQDEMEYSLRVYREHGRLRHQVVLVYKGGVSGKMLQTIVEKAAEVSQVLLVPQ